jgi:Holliday junction resolvase
MSNKAKGSKAERELYDLFVKNNFRAVRVAGSGMMENTACDLIAGKVGEKYAIEAKSSKAPVKYISKKQIEEFVIFSEIFGLIPVVALRFNREGWLFISPKQLRDSGKNWAITLEEAKLIGKRFGQFFCSSNPGDSTPQ